MTVTHRCQPCRTFSAFAARCTFCDEWMTPIEELSMSTKAPAPAPDWPDTEPDQAYVRTTRKRPTRTGTRGGA